MGASDWITEREAAVVAAKRAGAILSQWAGRVSVTMKGRNDPVTEADHEAQEVIRRYLEQRFPGDAFVGEEGSSATAGSDRRWIVDPLDGTTNFVHGFPFYCVSIALEADGRLVVGVIYDPIRKECFTAATGAGAQVNGAPFQVSGATALSGSLVCIGLPADLKSSSFDMGSLAQVASSTRSLRRMGSAALSLAYVACGRLDGFFAFSLHSWDAAAGAVLVREAGGVVSNGHNPGYDVELPDMIATNGLIHAELARAVAASRTDSVK